MPGSVVSSPSPGYAHSPTLAHVHHLRKRPSARSSPLPVTLTALRPAPPAVGLLLSPSLLFCLLHFTITDTHTDIRSASVSFTPKEVCLPKMHTISCSKYYLLKD